MRMSLSSKPSMMRISTAAGSAALKNEEVVGSLSFGRLSYENADRALAAHFWFFLSPFHLHFAVSILFTFRILLCVEGLRATLGQNWGSFFVRFSWFDTDGRMEHVSPASQAQDLQYTFDFKPL